MFPALILCAFKAPSAFDYCEESAAVMLAAPSAFGDDFAWDQTNRCTHWNTSRNPNLYKNQIIKHGATGDEKHYSNGADHEQFNRTTVIDVVIDEFILVRSRNWMNLNNKQQTCLTLPVVWASPSAHRSSTSPAALSTSNLLPNIAIGTCCGSEDSWSSASNRSFASRNRWRSLASTTNRTTFASGKYSAITIGTSWNRNVSVAIVVSSGRRPKLPSPNRWANVVFPALSSPIIKQFTVLPKIKPYKSTNTFFTNPQTPNSLTTRANDMHRMNKRTIMAFPTCVHTIQSFLVVLSKSVFKFNVADESTFFTENVQRQSHATRWSAIHYVYAARRIWSIVCRRYESEAIRQGQRGQADHARRQIQSRKETIQSRRRARSKRDSSHLFCVFYFFAAFWNVALRSQKMNKKVDIDNWKVLQTTNCCAFLTFLSKIFSLCLLRDRKNDGWRIAFVCQANLFGFFSPRFVVKLSTSILRWGDKTTEKRKWGSDCHTYCSFHLFTLLASQLQSSAIQLAERNRRWLRCLSNLFIKCKAKRIFFI